MAESTLRFFYFFFPGSLFHLDVKWMKSEGSFFFLDFIVVSSNFEHRTAPDKSVSVYPPSRCLAPVFRNKSITKSVNIIKLLYRHFFFSLILKGKESSSGEWNFIVESHSQVVKHQRFEVGIGLSFSPKASIWQPMNEAQQ